MTNAEKIALIKHYLDQPNCVGVEVEWEQDWGRDGIEKHKDTATDCYPEHRVLWFGLIEFLVDDDVKIIGDPKPIAIELDALKVGDKVWCKGDMGIVVETPATAPDDDYEYEIRLYGGGYSYGLRHELIKVMK